MATVQIKPDPEDSCLHSKSHSWVEFMEYDIGLRHYQILKCSVCDKLNTGWWPINTE